MWAYACGAPALSAGLVGSTPVTLPVLGSGFPHNPAPQCHMPGQGGRQPGGPLGWANLNPLKNPQARPPAPAHPRPGRHPVMGAGYHHPPTDKVSTVLQIESDYSIGLGTARCSTLNTPWREPLAPLPSHTHAPALWEQKRLRSATVVHGGLTMVSRPLAPLHEHVPTWKTTVISRSNALH